jgi:hypothetical protein
MQSAGSTIASNTRRAAAGQFRVLGSGGWESVTVLSAACSRSCSTSRACALPGGTLEEVGVEAILHPERRLSWLAALPAPNDVAEIVESFDARSSDNRRFGRRVAMSGERVRHTRRNDQQIAGPSRDDIILDQQVERLLDLLASLSPLTR